MARYINVKVLGDASSLERAFRKAGLSAKRFGASTGTLHKATRFLSAALIGGTGLGFAFKSTLDKAGEFQQGLNVLKSVSGATGAKMKKASALAMRLGNDVTLPATSASDAAAAMVELSKAGLSVNDVFSASKGVLQASAAAGIDNALSAQIVANEMNAFRLPGTQAIHIADLLAGAANAASGEMTDMADALRFTSTTAAQAGIPIEDTVAAIAEMANQGILGGQSGAALQQMLLKLESPTAKGAASMKKLGVNIYDAHGKMLPMRAVIKQFSEATEGMSDAQRNSALNAIFGSRAIRAANIVLLGGTKAFDQMSAATNKQGAAASLSRAKMKGYKGALDAFKSAIETLQISIGLKLLPSMTRLLHRGTAWLGNAKNQKRITDDVAQAVKSLGNFLQVAAKVTGHMVTVSRKVVDAVGGWKVAFGIVLTGVLASKLFKVAAAIRAIAKAEALAGGVGLAKGLGRNLLLAAGIRGGALGGAAALGAGGLAGAAGVAGVVLSAGGATEQHGDRSKRDPLLKALILKASQGKKITPGEQKALDSLGQYSFASASDEALAKAEKMLRADAVRQRGPATGEDVGHRGAGSRGQFPGKTKGGGGGAGTGGGGGGGGGPVDLKNVVSLATQLELARARTTKAKRTALNHELAELNKKLGQNLSKASRLAVEEEKSSVLDTLASMDKAVRDKRKSAHDAEVAQAKKHAKKLETAAKAAAAKAKEAAAKAAQALKDATESVRSSVGGLFEGSVLNPSEDDRKRALGAPGQTSDVPTLTADLNSQVKQATQFYKDIAILKKRGASPELIKELSEKGVSALPEADALAHATKGQLGAFNKAFAAKEKLIKSVAMKATHVTITTPKVVLAKSNIDGHKETVHHKVDVKTDWPAVEKKVTTHQDRKNRHGSTSTRGRHAGH